MSTDFTFSLPGGRLKVDPVMRISRAFEERSYVLLFDLERPFAETQEGRSLSWSDSLGSLFRYIPAMAAPGTLRMDGFIAPPHVERLQIRVRAWRTSEPSPVADLAIATELCGQPAVIFADGS